MNKYHRQSEWRAVEELTEKGNVSKSQLPAIMYNT